MPRVCGVDIPNDKPIWVSLTYIYGIGEHRSQKVLDAMNVDPQTRARELTDDEVSRIATHIENTYVVEGQLRRQVAQNIARLREINCYRGIRHRRGLPVRGQRTRTNARTRKGPKRTVAVKRSVKSKR